MRFILLFAIIVFSTANIFAQTNTKKADKFFELQQFEKAIDAYLKVIEKYPNASSAYLQIAECFYFTNKMRDAIEWYEKKINEPDVDPKYTLHYAQALRSTGSTDEAKIWFKILQTKDTIAAPHYLKMCETAIANKGKTPVHEVKNEYINSPSKDFSGAFYNNMFVYGSGRTDLVLPGKKLKLPGEGKAFNRLVTSTPDQNGYLKPPALFHSELQDQNNDMPVSFSTDNKWVVFTKGSYYEHERPFSGTGKEHNLYIARVNDRGVWIDVKAMPFNVNGYSTTWPFLAENGQKLYFASNRPGGYGGYDIYVSQRFGDKWSEPANIGDKVNTAGDEISPFIMGDKMYFSSDWYSVFGGFDICIAQKDDQKWQNPQVLLTGINSSYDDYGFVWNLDKNTGYFTSNREGGKGGDDIYRVRNIGAPYTLIVETPTGEPINLAIVDANDCGLSVMSTNTEGKVFFKTLPKEKCSCTISLDGYETQKLDVTRDEVFGSQTRKVVLQPRIIEYTFQLIMKSNGEPVPSIPVEISTQAGESVQKLLSDAAGEVKINLTKDKMYFFKTLSDNFKSESKLVNTSAKSEEKIKMIVTLEPTEAYFKQLKNEANKNYRSKGLYAVQVGVVKNSTPIDYAKYNKIVKGAIAYTTEDDGQKSKLRIGNFATKADAQTAIRLLTQNDVKGCFIVEDKEYVSVKKAEEPVAAKPAENKPAEVKPSEPKVVTKAPETKAVDVKPAQAEAKPIAVKPATVVKEEPKPEDNFRVRIAAVRDPKFSDDPKLAALGVVITEPAGEWTRVYLGYYKDLTGAKASLENAMKAGFKDAYVCTKKGNTWAKVK